MVSRAPVCGIKPDLIVVLGMHRSGTSVLARALQALNVDLGNRLMPGIDHVNPKGFWEDLDINHLDMAMLAALESDWHRLGVFHEHHFDHLEERGFLKEAVQLLRSKLDGHRVFGVKDPRMTKLLPLWKRAFAAMGLRVAYVISVRNPLSVAKSVRARDGFDLEVGYLLWLEHCLLAVAETEQDPRIFIDYDAVLENPRKQLKRLADAFCLDVNNAEVDAFSDGFLEKELRHSKHSPADPDLGESCLPLINEVFLLLLKMTVEPSASATKSEVASCWSEYSRILPLLQYVNRLQGKLADFSHFARLKGHLKNLEDMILEKDQYVIDLLRALREKDAYAARLQETLAVVSRSATQQLQKED
jgi:O-antigen biosynthesis protein